jgi:hypothetical protein
MARVEQALEQRETYREQLFSGRAGDQGAG